MNIEELLLQQQIREEIDKRLEKITTIGNIILNVLFWVVTIFSFVYFYNLFGITTIISFDTALVLLLSIFIGILVGCLGATIYAVTAAYLISESVRKEIIEKFGLDEEYEEIDD